MYSFYSHTDISYDGQFGIQDPATPNAEGMVFFHHYLNIFLVFIGFFVFWILYVSLNLNNDKSIKFSHSSVLEFIWTVAPAFTLTLIAVPSFSLLYSLDDLVSKPFMTLKVVGHQWYWSYEYTNILALKNVDKNMLVDISFDSYMLSTNDLGLGDFRLLSVDHKILLPAKRLIKVLVTSADVLHSWAIPSFGIKIDACPGRLSQGSLFIKREGIFFGQCSEICGVNHGFMPISVLSMSEDFFVTKYLFNGMINNNLINE